MNFYLVQNKFCVVVKILKNPSASLVKKRQTMRVTFGDYRSKMKEEEDKYLYSEY